ncbi:MAG: hypothetical protein HZA22_00280 [Nitrospirae bacterium]|nr:hypothetical protein [Nitrospirota bacterium]MBI5694393.1 hypothetical protein [Nitrospirota bacterium]
MSALTKDRNTVRKEGDYAVYPVKAAKKIFAGSIVCIGADGYALPGSDTAGLKFVGIARGYVDNTSGASGALKVEVWRRGAFELAASGMAITNAGDKVYVVDDQTVGLAATTANDVACGKITEFNTATSVYVDVAAL